MIFQKFINLTGRLSRTNFFRTKRARAVLVAMVPICLLLPFATDLTKQLPPLTIKVYTAADGNLYLRLPQDRSAGSAGLSAEDKPSVARSNVLPPAEPVTNNADITTRGVLAFETGAPKVTDAHTAGIAAVQSNADSQPYSQSIDPALQVHTAQTGHSRHNSLWRTPHYPATKLVDLMREYAFTSQLNMAANQDSIAPNWSINFKRMSNSELHASLSSGRGFAEQEVNGQQVIGKPSSTDLPNGFLRPQPAKKPHVVVLDPGHGGSDPGTIGAGGMLEKKITLDIAKRVQELARQQGDIEVLLTRNDDAGFARAQRVSIVKLRKPDLLLSLHLNNLPQKDLTLVETFYAGHENIMESLLSEKKARAMKTSSRASQIVERAEASKKIAGYLQDFVYDTVRSNNKEAINAGIKKDTLFMLTRSEVPGALIELSCLSNAEEEERLKSTEYRHQLAESILRAIEAYFDDVSDLPSA